jgi:hypothetical protein
MLCTTLFLVHHKRVGGWGLRGMLRVIMVSVHMRLSWQQSHQPNYQGWRFKGGTIPCPLTPDPYPLTPIPPTTYRDAVMPISEKALVLVVQPH